MNQPTAPSANDRRLLFRAAVVKIRAASPFYNDGKWSTANHALFFAIYQKALEDAIIAGMFGAWRYIEPESPSSQLLDIDPVWAVRIVNTIANHLNISIKGE